MFTDNMNASVTVNTIGQRMLNHHCVTAANTAANNACIANQGSQSLVFQ
ncbi:hypothetical protein AB395_00001716 [Sinorhizobium fredii CCBAU 45436]|nr:hypothetical protein AB395_00001716 [Sinorhizobium fredii CCBAU 45436]AWM25228.1 hypothetical protein AOX55_00001976 [Sinorhizobium fredii CCBAU 25509]